MPHVIIDGIMPQTPWCQCHIDSYTIKNVLAIDFTTHSEKWSLNNSYQCEVEIQNLLQVGKEGCGIVNISSMLNITRLHNSVASIGIMRR